jgi:hypothetical protein
MTQLHNNLTQKNKNNNEILEAQRMAQGAPVIKKRAENNAARLETKEYIKQLLEKPKTRRNFSQERNERVKSNAKAKLNANAKIQGDIDETTKNITMLEGLIVTKKNELADEPDYTDRHIGIKDDVNNMMSDLAKLKTNLEELRSKISSGGRRHTRMQKKNKSRR